MAGAAGGRSDLLTLPAGAAPGDVPVRVLVRSAGFAPIGDATVDVRVSAPDGRMEQLRAGHRPRDASAGGAETDVPPARAVRRLSRDRGGAPGRRRSRFRGGFDARRRGRFRDDRPPAEHAAPSAGRAGLWRRHGRGRRRVCAGRHAARPVPGRRVGGEPRSLEHAWSFLAIVMLLSAEWLLRRRWGLR